MRLEILFIKSVYPTDGVRIVTFTVKGNNKSILEIDEFGINDAKKLDSFISHIEKTANEMGVNIHVSEEHKAINFGRTRKLISKALKIIETLKD